MSSFIIGVLALGYPFTIAALTVFLAFRLRANRKYTSFGLFSGTALMFIGYVMQCAGMSTPVFISAGVASIQFSILHTVGIYTSWLGLSVLVASSLVIAIKKLRGHNS